MEFLPLLLHGVGQGIASTVPGTDTVVPGTHLPPTHGHLQASQQSGLQARG